MSTLREAKASDPRVTQARVLLPLMAASLFAILSMTIGPAALAGSLDKVVFFHIDAQSLDKALLQFGHQADLRISCSCDLSKVGLRTRELDGSYTGRQALAKLLEGTRLRYVADNRTVDILAQAPQDPNTGARADRSSGTAHRTDPASAADPKSSVDPKTQPSDPPAARRDSRSTQPVPTLSEIIVTAQKYSQRAFDVPISLDVITAQELHRLDITSLNDLQYDVAGMYVMGGNINHYIVLRGVSNGSGNGAIVGQYIDDADISSEGYTGQSGYGTGELQLYDLDRVEVLKGPQGTLYGDGALGGVIRYITNKPQLDRDQLSADVAASFTQYGAPSQRIEAMANAPLITGTLGLRVAGQFQHEGGWVDEPVASLKNINDVNLTDLRIEALWQPTTAVKLLATQVIHRESYGVGSGEDAEGNITPVYGVTLVPTGNQSLTLSNLTLTVDLPSVELLNSATYSSHSEKNYNQSYALTGIPAEVELLAYQPLGSHTFSDELRLHSMGHGPWRWMLGGFYKHELDDIEFGASEYYGPPAPSLATAEHLYITGGVQQSDSEAVFADTSFRAGRFTIGAGGRYFENRFSFSNFGDYIGNVRVYPRLAALAHYTSTDPRFYLQYHQSDDVDIYASAAKGFRSGEPNLGLFVGYDPESLWSYDVGTKVRFLDGRVRSNEDVFYEKYSNYVGEGLVTVYGVPTYGTFNIGAAGIKGVDVDLAWRPSARWRVSAKGEIVDSKYTSITVAQTGYLPGERVGLVPSYTIVGSVERDFIWGGRPGFAQANYSQTAPVVSFSSPLIQSDVMRFLSFRTGVKWTSDLKLAFFAENLLNDRGYLDPNWNQTAAFRPRPRTFGIEFTVSSG